MRSVLRALAVAAVTSTVVLAGTVADAAPPAGKGNVKVHGPAAKGVKSAKGGAKSAALVAKLVAQAERALDRAVAPTRTVALTADSVAALQANVEADRALLATYTSRTELAGFRAVNYVLVVNVVREAEALLATTDPASSQGSALPAVVDAALTVTATTPKADVTALLEALEVASVAV
jgi:hypothetical protein